MANNEVTLYELPNYGGKTMSTIEDQNDLTATLPKGASSITFGKDAKEWRVFTGINFQGTNNTLEPGRRYPNVDAMGIGAPVMSMRKTV